MPKSRIFLFLLLAFVAGVALASFVIVPLFFVWAGGVAIASIMAAGVLRKNRAVILYGFFFLAFLGGIFRFNMTEAHPSLSPFYGREISAKGFIVREPETTSRVQRLKVQIEEINGKKISAPFYLLAALGRYPAYDIGDELLLAGVLDRPENLGEFDYAAYLAKDDVFSIMSFPEVEKTGQNRGNKIYIWLSKLKLAFEANIDRALPEPHGAFLKGLTLGERESLPDELVENFNRTGTTHIVALSGYNITLVARFFMTLLLLLTLPFQAAFWIASAGIAFFVMLTGASPSVVRAGVMGILVLIAQREGRVYHMRNALAFAAAVMIFHNPKILRWDAAFQLSFLATLGLVYLSPHVRAFSEKTGYRISSFFSRRRKLPTPEEKRRIAEKEKYSLFKFKQTLVETLSAQLMVLPLLIYLFGRASAVSPITNILILMAVPYSMILGFITGGLGFIWGPLAQITGWLNWVLLEYKIQVINLFAAIPGASVEIGKWMSWPVAVLYGFIFWRLWKKSGKT